MSILPGWAHQGRQLPPWYGPGGARGVPNPIPSSPLGQNPNTGVVRPPTTPTRPMPNRATSGGSRGVSIGHQLPRTGNVAQQNQTPVNTAPTNPWIDPKNNNPIYQEDISGELGLLDKLLRDIQAGKTTTNNNTRSRLDSIGTGSEGIEDAVWEDVAPTERKYDRSGELGESIGMARDWATTGGFSDQDLASIRARGVSPIRAVYANANRNMNRQRALQGGYSPGMNAAISRMAREQSEQLASASTNLEADIADRVQKGRALGLEKFTGLSERENSLIADIMRENAAAKDRASQINASGRSDTSRFNAGSANEATLGRERLRDSVMSESMTNDNRYADMALQLAKLRQDMIEGNRSGRLNERNTSRAGNLNWEELNQRGGQALIDALMQQYGGR